MVIVQYDQGTAPTTTTLPPQRTILVHSLPGQQHAYQLIHRIRSTRHTVQPPAQTGNSREGDDGDGDEALTWTIKNKYYQAKVAFQLQTEAAGPTENEEPAVIVLVSRTQIPSPTLQLLLETLSARSPEFEIALLLLLSPSSPSSEEPIDDQAWDDLAIDHGFEFIDLHVSEGAPKKDEEKEHGEERTGLDRVAEALQAHLWEGMTVLERERKDTRDTSGITEDGEEEEDEEEGNPTFAPPLPAPRPFVPTPLSFPSTFLPSISPLSKASSSQSTFDDDFSPFAAPLASTSFPPLDPPPSSSTTIPTSSLPPSLLFFDTAADRELEEILRLERDGEQEDELEQVDELDELVDKLTELRKEAGEKGLGLEERRRLAERVMLDLLGE